MSHFNPREAALLKSFLSKSKTRLSSLCSSKMQDKTSAELEANFKIFQPPHRKKSTKSFLHFYHFLNRITTEMNIVHVHVLHQSIMNTGTVSRNDIIRKRLTQNRLNGKKRTGSHTKHQSLHCMNLWLNI